MWRQTIYFNFNLAPPPQISNGASLTKNHDSTSAVLQFLKDKLEIQLSASDIVAAHPLPQNCSGSNRVQNSRPLPAIIVIFLKNTTKCLVIQNRRKLKGNTSKISIREDLTRKNMLLLNRVKHDDRVSAACSSRGLILCKFKNSNVKINVRLFETIDGALLRSNPGAQHKYRLTQQARGATKTDSIESRLHNLDGMSPPAGTP